jgi:hypothetical protein
VCRVSHRRDPDPCRDRRGARRCVIHGSTDVLCALEGESAQGVTDEIARHGRRVLGALLDGIPESVAIGVSLLGGDSVGVAVVAAVFLSTIAVVQAFAAGAILPCWLTR